MSLLFEVVVFEESVRKADSRAAEPVRVAPVRLKMPPGMVLNRVTRFLLTARAHKLYVEPSIGDMQCEYYAAVANKELWHARWIALRVWFLVVPGVVWGVVAGIFAKKTLG
jgi:hypothetical protein